MIGLFWGDENTLGKKNHGSKMRVDKRDDPQTKNEGILGK